MMKQNVHAERIQILSLSKHALGRFFLIVTLLLSNINDVIRAVLNSLFFLFTKRFRTHKKHKKHQKHKSTKTQPSKSTKTQISEQN